MIRKLFLFVLILIALGALGLLGYGYLGELPPESTPTKIPVQLDAQ
ncbi:MULTISPECIES: hypothetical protein [Dinoroseobacter]|nr:MULTISPECIES: hypothetical protein [Dinoroseobacter]MDD9715556.1 hypothetical protein [Dinoroseobacter sp. PD6]URF48267.1 hypothetical protein M8008_08300 [Dinoroseobacter shibae]URF52577.1 hypothetical protein M8007_08300 [Dinoroseobacter shibae]